MRVLHRLGARHGTIEFTSVDMALDNTAPDADEVWAAVCSATAFQVAELRLGGLGWDPRVLGRSAVVNEVERIGPETFRLRLSRRWQQVVAAFNAAKS